MNETEIRINGILQDEFGLFDLAKDSPIFTTGRLDSMDVLRLITELEKTFSISISAFEVSLEMFDTIDSIANVIHSKLN